MSFFKKRKNQNNNNLQPGPVENGTVAQPQKVVVPQDPPLLNFLPPPDVVADALAKTNRRSTSSVSEILMWARDYFCAFIKSDGFEDLFNVWEESMKLVEDLKTVEENKLEENFKRRLQLLKSHVGICSPNLDTTKFDELGEVKDCLEWVTEVCNKLEAELQDTCLPRYIESKFHVKCQMDLFTNGSSISLYDVLLNQSALFYFMEYAEQEGKREVLEFWLGATNFAEQFSNSNSFPGTNSTIIDVKTAVSDAMVLYEKYISLQAPHPLGIRDEIRSEIEAKICSQDEVCHCFNNAIVEAFAFLHVTCLEGFLKSSLFLSFLSDLIGSMNSSKPQQPQDSSSVGSSGSVKSYPISTSSSLTSPTPIRDRERGKLTMGRVTALGKFEADVGCEMFNKKESGIAKTMKKLVNFDDKEKAKEDLAWQVAAMIVNEVTSVTMGPPAGESN